MTLCSAISPGYSVTWQMRMKYPSPTLSLHEPFLGESTSSIKSIIISMKVIKIFYLASSQWLFLLAYWALCTQNKTSQKTAPAKSPTGHPSFRHKHMAKPLPPQVKGTRTHTSLSALARVLHCTLWSWELVLIFIMIWPVSASSVTISCFEHEPALFLLIIACPS